MSVASIRKHVATLTATVVGRLAFRSDERGTARCRVSSMAKDTGNRRLKFCGGDGRSTIR